MLQALQWWILCIAHQWRRRPAPPTVGASCNPRGTHAAAASANAEQIVVKPAIGASSAAIAVALRLSTHGQATSASEWGESQHPHRGRGGGGGGGERGRAPAAGGTLPACTRSGGGQFTSLHSLTFVHGRCPQTPQHFRRWCRRSAPALAHFAPCWTIMLLASFMKVEQSARRWWLDHSA